MRLLWTFYDPNGPEIEDRIRLHSLWLSSSRTKGLRADFSRDYLPGVDLNDVDLRDANFAEATLRNVNFRNANLSGADISNADLANAFFVGSNLSDADLRGSCLASSNLCGASLRGADIRGADLAAAWLDGYRYRHIAENIPPSADIVECRVDLRAIGSSLYPLAWWLERGAIVE